MQSAGVLWLGEYGLDLRLGIKMLLRSFADVKCFWESPVKIPYCPVMALSFSDILSQDMAR